MTYLIFGILVVGIIAIWHQLDRIATTLEKKNLGANQKEMES